APTAAARRRPGSGARRRARRPEPSPGPAVPPSRGRASRPPRRERTPRGRQRGPADRVLPTVFAVPPRELIVADGLGEEPGEPRRPAPRRGSPFRTRWSHVEAGQRALLGEGDLLELCRLELVDVLQHVRHPLLELGRALPCVNLVEARPVAEADVAAVLE